MTTWQDIGTEGRPTRVLVCGGRDFNDRELLDRTLRFIDRHRGPIGTIIHGAAPGADTLAATWAKDVALDVAGEILAFPADWKQHGRAAGPIRNQRMLDEGKPDLVVAFPGGRGTADMVARARKAGIKVMEVRPSPPSKEGE
ncbi:MAG: DUF2493 domain-containing protein [Rhizobiales bacterium]|nr:DUF2493 domain-containing protein [Hyphomicrobiales bacterium]